MKKLLKSILIACAILAVPSSASAADVNQFTPPEVYETGTPITIHIDGMYLPCDVDPIIQNGRILIPMRAAGEALDAVIGWDGNNRCVTVAKGDDLIYFFVDSTDYLVNGESRSTDVAPTIINNRTLLPLRVFAEALGTRVDWDQYLLDVSISTNGQRTYLPNPPIDTANDVYRFVQKFYTPSISSANSIFGSWKYSGDVYDAPGEIYEFFYQTDAGIQNVEVIAAFRPYFDFPTIEVFKSNTRYETNRYLRLNWQDILYVKDMGKGYAGHLETEFKMLDNNLVETGLLQYALGTGEFEYYTAIGPNVFTRF
jgi:hypothetical protein